MNKDSINRRQLFSRLGLIGLGCCGATAFYTSSVLSAQESALQKPTVDAIASRTKQRMDFAEGWLKRFIEVLDSNLDDETKKKIMMANGQSCYQSYLLENKIQVTKLDFGQWAEWIKANVKTKEITVEGNTIYFQYVSSAETGKLSEDGQCLCPFVENKPQGLSPTYCLCSVGYVKNMHEKLFGKACEVELLESVLKGGKRCRFKITVK